MLLKRRADEQRRLVADELRARGRPELVGSIEGLPDRFLVARAASSIATHLVLAAEPVGSGQVWTRVQAGDAPGSWELLVVTRDRPGILATMAGVLSLRGLNIVTATAATLGDVALDAFAVVGPEPGPLPPETWSGVVADLADALSGRTSLHERIEQAGKPIAGATAEVGYDNRSDPADTLIEVRAPDRLGLLYHTARAIRDLALDIHHADIASPQRGSVDVFNVRDLNGRKLDDPVADRVARAIEARLNGWLSR